MIFTDDGLLPVLDRYLAGECTASEAVAVRDWLVSAPQEHETLLADIQRIRNLVKDRPPVRSAQSHWRSIAHELGLISPAGNSLSPTLGAPQALHQTGSPRGTGRCETVLKPHPLRGWIWSVAVAAVLVVAMASWNARAFHGGRPTKTSMMTYTTGNGERATIVLPDGGTVALNVASRLEVPMDYMAGHRTVRLAGEGLFTISHKEGTPLAVVAGGTTARVLGTSFVVRRYATDTTTMVAVLDGKVAVGTKVVTANQAVEVGPSGVSRVRVPNVSPVTFATGTLTIDGLLLPAAIVELDRWYDADVRLGSPVLAKERMKGTFGAGSLGDLEERLHLMYDVRVVREGRVLTLYPKR